MSDRFFRLWNRDAKRGIVCPMCCDPGLTRRDTGWREDEYSCGRCGCRFELDTGDFLDCGGPIFFSPFMSITEKGSRDGFDMVLNWLRWGHPEWREVLDDPEVRMLMRDVFDYNEWLNRGNGPSRAEMVEDGTFEADVRCILGRGDALDAYFDTELENTPEEERGEVEGLYRRFRRLKDRYAGAGEGRTKTHKIRRNRR